MDSAMFEALHVTAQENAKRAHEALKFPRQEETQCVAKLQKLMDEADGTQLVSCLHFTSRLYNVRTQLRALTAAAKAADTLASYVQGLRTSWIVAYHGVGTFGAHFFVRSYELDDEKRPIAYDPFWVEALIHDPGKREEYAKRATTAPVGGTYAKPIFDLQRPFGAFEEAALAACERCRRPSIVVGHKDLCHWTEDDDWPYPQELYALCSHCPHLSLIGRREDPRPVKLHP